MTYCHHDDLILDERDVRLMRSFLKWVDTARQAYQKPGWNPSDVDIAKSRLFWWVRSGHDPLPHPPPTAYSCPWYEVVTEPHAHHCTELYADIERLKLLSGDAALVNQCFYKIIERLNGEYILGYGPYRFRAYRDIEAHADYIVSINPPRPNLRDEILGRIKDGDGWYLRRSEEHEKLLEQTG